MWACLQSAGVHHNRKSTQTEAFILTFPHQLSKLLPFNMPLPACLPACAAFARVELIVHENLEVMSVGEALARADAETGSSEQQRGLPLQILDEQISEPQERSVGNRQSRRFLQLPCASVAGTTYLNLRPVDCNTCRHPFSPCMRKVSHDGDASNSWRHVDNTGHTSIPFSVPSLYIATTCTAQEAPHFDFKPPPIIRTLSSPAVGFCACSSTVVRSMSRPHQP